MRLRESGHSPFIQVRRYPILTCSCVHCTLTFLGSVLTPQVLATAPKDLHHLWCDTPELAAGYALWLAVSGDTVDFLRGRYSSANWDVAELVARREEIMSKDLLWTRVVGQEQLHSKDDLEP
jgi:hypothetical protein